MEKQYNFYNFEASFKKYLLAGKKTPVTIKNYLSDIRHFFGWLIFKLKGDGVKFSENNQNFNYLNLIPFINEKIVVDYKNYLIENKIPVKTINRRLSVVRKLCSFCISQGWLKENPAKKITNIRDKSLGLNKALISFGQYLEKEGLPKTSISSYLSDVQEFLEFAYE